MDFGVTGKVAIVTGGSSGIGLAIAKSFAAEGAKVVINGRDQAKLDAAVRGDRTNSAAGIVADLTRPEGAAALADFAARSARSSFSSTISACSMSRTSSSISDERWHEYFEANVMTGVRITRPVLKDMLSRNSGSVVFISQRGAQCGRYPSWSTIR